MKFGVNYTPSGEWFYTWLNPKWEVIRRDLAQIAELGADHCAYISPVDAAAA